MDEPHAVDIWQYGKLVESLIQDGLLRIKPNVLPLDRMLDNDPRRRPSGDVILQLKTPYTDGTTPLLFSGLEFVEKLAALIPPARVHLTRFFWMSSAARQNSRANCSAAVAGSGAARGRR